MLPNKFLRQNTRKQVDYLFYIHKKITKFVFHYTVGRNKISFQSISTRIFFFLPRQTLMWKWWLSLHNVHYEKIDIILFSIRYYSKTGSLRSWGLEKWKDIGALFTALNAEAAWILLSRFWMSLKKYSISQNRIIEERITN